MPSVEVIVVTWNHRYFVERLFDGLRATDYPKDSWTVHIVDNASKDGTGEAVRQCIAGLPEGFPTVHFTAMDHNSGFAEGNNVVMRHTNADYVYLLNPDASFEPETLRRAVEAAEKNPNAASVQSFLILMQSPGLINSVGNDIHFAGHGYCRGYKQPVSSAPKDITPIIYASGAGSLYRMSVLKRIGFFDETLFAYHEDLEMGWRMLLAGYDNLLAPSSVLLHHYEFSRSVKKWYLMERNRGIVILTMYKIPTIVILLPGLFAIELATWLFAIKGGWIRDKAKAVGWFFIPSSIAYLLRKRREMKRIRTRKDREILARFVFGIEHQDADPWFMRRIANPLMKIYYKIVKAIVRW
ncbi:MAG: glycosyltransferase family 2 protein [Patescibacteria group bacterium]